MRIGFSKNRVLVYTVIIWLVVSVSGCGRAVDTPPTKDQLQTSGKVYPLTITDDLGRQITLAAEPARIVSLAPSNTEILYALGLGAKIVGNTTYCDYPEEAKQCYKVGGFADPSLEKIVAVKPDLVLASDIHMQILKVMEDAGLKVIVLNAKSLEGVFGNILLVGKAAGVEDKATELAQDLKKRVDGVNAQIAQVPTGERPLVYYELWYEPYMSVGKDTLIAQLIRLAGGINMTDDNIEQYPKLSQEVIIERNPAVMINSYGHGSGALITPQQIAARKGWSQLDFIKNNRIYTIESDLLSLAGPRIVDGLETMARALHPSLFK
ncbi:MAG: cobalamin-binding protein [Syntrophomonadaceae bacterium]